MTRPAGRVGPALLDNIGPHRRPHLSIGPPATGPGRYCRACGRQVDRIDAVPTEEVAEVSTRPDDLPWLTVLAIRYTARPCGCVFEWRRDAPPAPAPEMPAEPRHAAPPAPGPARVARWLRYAVAAVVAAAVLVAVVLVG